MNFIEKDGKTLAVRPEDVTITTDSKTDLGGSVRTIMILGHYVVVNVQCGENVVQCFVDRELSDKLKVGDQVGLTIGKHTVF
jgi:putative spermidine/putrescine transport system ATP-binding protein